MTVLSLPMDAAELVPHRRPMQLVDRLVKCDDKSGVVETVIADDHPLVNAEGQLEPVLLVELIAQGYAVFRGYSDRLAGLGVRRGLLVGAKKISCTGPVPAGKLLRIKTWTTTILDDFAVADGEVWCDDQLLASGEIKVYIQDA